jgi:hypothetical protein
MAAVGAGPATRPAVISGQADAAQARSGCATRVWVRHARHARAQAADSGERLAGAQGWQGRSGALDGAPRPAPPGEISAPRPAPPSAPAQKGEESTDFKNTARSLVTSIKFVMGRLCTSLHPSEAIVPQYFFAASTIGLSGASQRAAPTADGAGTARAGSRKLPASSPLQSSPTPASRGLGVDDSEDSESMTRRTRSR